MLRDFLSQAVEPPPLPSIKNAVQLLEEIGALTPKSEKLTLLGSHLATLPLPPRVSKMLLYGILFSVLDPLLTVACCIAYRSALYSSFSHLIDLACPLDPAPLI